MIITRAAFAASALLSVAAPAVSAQSGPQRPPTAAVVEIARGGATITSVSCLARPARDLPGVGIVAASSTDLPMVAAPTILSCLAAPRTHSVDA